MRGRLERSFDVLTVNLAGHVGGPELEERPVSVDVLVDAVEKDMDAAGVDTAHVVGNSLGGWIAFELGRRGRARSIVALSPGGGHERGSREERRVRRMFFQMYKLSNLILPRVDSLVRRPRMRRALFWQVVVRGDRIPPAAAAQMIRDSVGCSVYFDLLEAIGRDGPPVSLHEVRCPVLIAWGTKDRILPSPKYSRRLRAMLPDAEWVELRGLGHVPMSDDPDLVARTITEFVGRVREPAAVATGA